MEKVGGYCRVSTDVQVEKGTSIADQKELIKEHCKKNGYELVKLYVDEGISGATDPKHRSALRRMMKDAENGEFNRMCFTKLDRLARSNRRILNILHSMKELNIKINCLAEPTIGSDSMTGEIMTNILGLVSQIERKMITDRMRRGRLSKFKKGIITNNVAPYGFKWNGKDKRIEVDERQRRIFLQIVNWYINAGYSIKQIAIQLNKRRVKTPSQDKKRKNCSTKWNANTVRKILSEEYYHTGIFHMMKYDRIEGANGKTYQSNKELPEKEWIAIELPKKFITELEWNRIQKRREAMKHRVRKRHADVKDAFMLENVSFKCGYCGGKMQKRIKREKSGIIRKYYVCYWKYCGKQELEAQGHAKCEMPRVNSDVVDKEVLKRLAWILSNPAKYYKEWLSSLDSAKLKERRDELIALISEQENKIDNIYNALSEVTTDAVRSRFIGKLKKDELLFQEYNDELQNLRFQFQAYADNEEILKQFKSKKNVVKIRKELMTFILSLDFKDKKRFVEALINPETAGEVFLDWVRASDVLTDKELKNNKIEPSEILTDRKPIVNLRFLLDMKRAGAVIESLNPNDFITSRYTSGVTRRSYGLD